MLFVVIERFKPGNLKHIGERLRSRGRMLPEGVVYHASWVDSSGAQCFQVVEAPDRDSLNAWTSSWDDLVDSEIVPVLTSSDFWSKIQPE